MLISQFWGRGDRESINRVMGIGFFVAGGISTLCALTMGLFPRQVLMLITDNARLVELGTSYIRIVGFSYILNSLSSIYIGMQQSIENPRFGMTVFAISTVCNTVGNYILIFGKLGLPKLSDNMDPEDARALRSYLYQMQEQLQYVLTNLDTENMSDTLRSKLQGL